VKSIEHINRLPGPSNFRPIKPEPTGVVAPLRNVRLLITLDIVVQARRYVAAGAVKGMIVEWRDVAQTGLVLRLTSTAATWYLRRRSSTLRIGNIEDTGVATAREMARKALAFGDLGDPRVFLENLRRVRAERGDEAAYYYEEGMWFDDDGTLHGPEVPMPERIWTWSYLRKRYLEYKIPTVSKHWAAQCVTLLNHPCFARIEHKPVGLLSYQDLDEVKKEAKKISSESQRSRAIEMARCMLEWAYEEHASDTGLANLQFVFWERWKIGRKAVVRDHAPTIAELARTLVLVEHLHSLSDAPCKLGSVDASLVRALWGAILTGQRIGQLLATPTGRFTTSDDLPHGWQLLHWKPGEVKSIEGLALPHALPIPLAAMSILDRWSPSSKAADSGWMFPSLRGSGHVSTGGLGGLLRRLQGIRYNGRKERDGDEKADGERVRGRSGKGSSKTKGDDLFARYGIDPWIPHDVRRTITSFLGEQGLGGAASAILSHREYSKERLQEHERNKMLAVTHKHYNRSQKIKLKAEGMALWVDELLIVYQEEKRTFGGELRSAVDEVPKTWSVPSISEAGGPGDLHD